MRKKRLLVLMVILGIGLLLISGTLFANTYFCLFNKASCGMVEPFYAIPAGVLGAVLSLAGTFGLWRRRRR